MNIETRLRDEQGIEILRDLIPSSIIGEFESICKDRPKTKQQLEKEQFDRLRNQNLLMKSKIENKLSQQQQSKE